VDVVKSFFTPPKSAEKLKISRWIASTTYLTLPPFLNASSTPELPIPTRSFLLDVLSDLVGIYGIEDVYWAVWGGGHGKEQEEKGRSAPEELLWEEAIRSIVGIPAKAANAVGRWSSDGWMGELPERLIPK
jgi:telomere length regulation protein